MKFENFDWLLQGCHPLSKVAQAYCPCERNSSSIRAFRKNIKEIAALYADLQAVGYTDALLLLTPLQIAAILRHMGFPDQARRDVGK